MNATLQQIAEAVNGRVEGNAEQMISALSTVEDVQQGELTFVFERKYLTGLLEREMGGVLIEEEILTELKERYPDLAKQNFIVVTGARLAVATLLQSQQRDDEFPTDQNQVADHTDDAPRGKNVRIYPGAYLGKRVAIGDNVTIYPGCYIGDDVKIGSDVTLYPNVVLYRETLIGSRVQIHAGAVIGADGYGYVPVDGKYHKVPQIGSVVIEDDVEIGACTTIDRATVSKTRIKKGTKIDNLVHIAHNVVIGEDSIICGQCGIAGNTKVGDRLLMGGKAGIIDNRSIGDDVKVSPNTGVIKNVASGQHMSGWLARPHKEAIYQTALLSKLPRLISDVTELKEKIREK